MTKKAGFIQKVDEPAAGLRIKAFTEDLFARCDLRPSNPDSSILVRISGMSIDYLVMISTPLPYFMRTVELFQKDDAAELVREGHITELQKRARFSHRVGESVRAAEDEDERRAAVARCTNRGSKLHRCHRFPALIEDEFIAVDFTELCEQTIGFLSLLLRRRFSFARCKFRNL
mgnify:CR=1 FL=1